MACRILRAPAVAQNICKNVPDLFPGLSFSSCRSTRYVGVLGHVQKRGYQNYKTHGEMAELKDPSDGTVFSEEPEYPVIVDATLEGQELRTRQTHYQEVRGMPTAHHKMFLINVERGREEMMYVGDLHYNSLDMYQYATRTTHKMEEADPAIDAGAPDSELASLVEEALVINKCTTPTSENAKRWRETNMIRCILDAVRYHHKLADTVVLEEPRIEAFWQHPRFRTNRNKERFGDKETYAPWFQFRQHAQLMVSSEIPLQPIVDPQSEETFETNLPTYDYYPEEMGMYEKKHYLVSTAGYWCNAFQYPLLTTSALEQVLPSSLDPSVSTDHLNSSERRRRLAAHGLMMNFATAVGAATSCGFTVFHDVTYPFVGQHIVTDGQTWHFSKYQLNTMAFGPDFASNKCNLAWSSEEMKLYDTIENGKVCGLNPSVLSRIADTVRAPRLAVENPRPYCDLGVEREFLQRGEKMFKSQAARKFIPQHAVDFEVPMWVKIYKMHEDAPPSPNLVWQRPRQKAQHITQYNKELYEEEIKGIKDKFKRITREKFYGLRALGREIKPRGVHPSGRN